MTMRATLAIAFVAICLVASAAAKPNPLGIQYDEQFREVRTHEWIRSAFALGADPRASGVMGGTNCAACTILVSMVEQLAYIHSTPILEVVETFCDRFPSPVEELCDVFVETYGDAIINAIELEQTPDYVCQQIGICTDGICNLFPPPTSEQKAKAVGVNFLQMVKPINEAWHSRLSGILDWIDNFAEYHNPLFDTDGDKFSAWGTFRGSYWRGKDCDDIRDEIYPGRKSTDYPPSVDHNCNGIYGMDQNGTLWEDKLCADTPQFGTAILGDSAAAHFHIPVDWVNPLKITETTFDSILRIAENEFDWPEMSATTGYTNINWIGHPNGIVNSSYVNALQNNRCTMRDYQNCGVNGARTSSMASNIMYSYARNQEEDFPAILTYALIGNDVCNPHPGFSHMTTPTEFYDNVVTAMDYLDTQLPMGSHVILMGLADGLILYESMAERIYPLGELRQDVTYGDVYDYLNCLQISPCYGWTDSHEAVRNATQHRANNLTAQYLRVIENNSYEHFDMHFINCPVGQVVDQWEANGGEAWQLIEAVDGFHPNQMSNALISEFVWEEFSRRLPELIQPVNPNNDQIKTMFGDQGGY